MRRLILAAAMLGAFTTVVSAAEPGGQSAAPAGPERQAALQLPGKEAMMQLPASLVVQIQRYIEARPFGEVAAFAIPLVNCVVLQSPNAPLNLKAKAVCPGVTAKVVTHAPAHVSGQ